MRLSSSRRVWIVAVMALALLLIAAALALRPGRTPSPAASRPRHVIVMIGDGMGFNHIAGADLYESGETTTQAYMRFPVRQAASTFPSGGSYDPASAWSDFGYVKSAPTDSAAAATAMSTGTKTTPGSIGVGPDGGRLTHSLEIAEEQGWATGVVTSVEFSHATPAGFVAHSASRDDYAAIANEMLTSSAVDVIMGCGNPDYTDSGEQRAATAGDFDFVGGADTWAALRAGKIGGDADGDGDADAFTLIQDRAAFQQLSRGDTPTRVCGVAHAATTLQQARPGTPTADAFAVPFNPGVPTLAEMTAGALNVLDADEDGLFLMVEGGAIDWASHANQPGRLIEEQAAFNDAVNAVIAWVEANSSWDDTLLIVTADHETGYLTGAASASRGPVYSPVVGGAAGEMPAMQFNSDSHTNSLVPLFAKGMGASGLASAAVGQDPMRGPYSDNTDVAKTIARVIEQPAAR